MRTALLPVLLLLAMGAPGCLVVALNPAYDDEHIEFDEGLVGEWTAAEEGYALEFERAEWRSYLVRISDGRQEARLTGRLTRAGEQTLVDLTPRDGVDLPALALPVHAICRVRREGDRLSVSWLDAGAVAVQTRSTAGADVARDSRQHLVLTADTSALREWLATAADGVFGEPVEFSRRSAAPPPR